jgi:hypothetical protein
MAARSRLSCGRGHKSHDKVIRIDGLPEAGVYQRLLETG